MAVPFSNDECEKLTRSFSGVGIGVDEKTLISILGKWHPEQRHLFRKKSSRFFKVDGHHQPFERWEEEHIGQLETEFARFKKAVVLWTMHPWERDARWVHHVVSKLHPQVVLIEIACTRSSEELLGVRRAYHALFHHSLEEDVAHHVKESNNNLLVGLLSAYRYEGPRVSEETAKSEAKSLGNAIKNAGAKKPIENEEVIRILTTRSKLHLKTTFKYYKEIYGNAIDEDLKGDLSLQETVQCLDYPPTYFSKVLDVAMKDGVEEHTKEAITRVIVTRADADMKEIKEEYHKNYGIPLEEKIGEATNGNYKDFLLTLVQRGD